MCICVNTIYFWYDVKTVATSEKQNRKNNQSKLKNQLAVLKNPLRSILINNRSGERKINYLKYLHNELFDKGEKRCLRFKSINNWWP